jgi:hypothetical protein
MELMDTKCTRCGSDKTYTDRNRNHWHHNENGIICKRCYNQTKLLTYLRKYMKIYRIDRKEHINNYKKIWLAEHPDYRRILYMETGK